MATGVVFLATSLEDAPKTVGSYKPGNTDQIRTMLREQQKDCALLHSLPLFKEFRGDVSRQRNKGGAEASNAPVFDDLVSASR